MSSVARNVLSFVMQMNQTSPLHAEALQSLWNKGAARSNYFRIIIWDEFISVKIYNIQVTSSKHYRFLLLFLDIRPFEPFAVLSNTFTISLKAVWIQVFPVHEHQCVGCFDNVLFICCLFHDEQILFLYPFRL